MNTKKLPSYAQFNFYNTSLNRWHGEGTSNTEPILNTTRSHNYLPTTNLLESGDYIRIRSIQLGYNFEQSVTKALGVAKLRVFANTQNPLTFKQNSGYTPEIGGSILAGNVDDGGTYPMPTTYTFGVTVNF